MRLWLNPTSEVSLREQLSTQVVLGILCGEIRPGERLPSTRELARRFGIHANTASATYTRLEKEGWVEFRLPARSPHLSGAAVRVPCRDCLAEFRARYVRSLTSASRQITRPSGGIL